MAKKVISFSVEDKLADEASGILEELGLVLSTYLRMCVLRLIREEGLPFSEKDEASSRGILAMKKVSKRAEENGISDMTLEEINEEIKEARKSHS